jgi:hypothetical protein
MGQAVHSGLRIGDVENTYVVTLPTQSCQDMPVPKLRSRFEAILSEPHTRKELSWQLGAGGWKLRRLRLLLACGLVGRRFGHPRKNMLPSMNQLRNRP